MIRSSDETRKGSGADAREGARGVRPRLNTSSPLALNSPAALLSVGMETPYLRDNRVNEGNRPPGACASSRRNRSTNSVLSVFAFMTSYYVL